MLQFFMAIAQMNWGTLKYPLEDERMIEFSNSISTIYSLAEDHPGFIWRIPDEETKKQLLDNLKKVCIWIVTNSYKYAVSIHLSQFLSFNIFVGHSIYTLFLITYKFNWFSIP